MAEYDVHMFLPVRFKVERIEADSQIAAIEKARSESNVLMLIHSIFNNESRWLEKEGNPEGLVCIELGEEGYEEFLVDEIGDRDYDNTRRYHWNPDNPSELIEIGSHESGGEGP